MPRDRDDDRYDDDRPRRDRRDESDDEYDRPRRSRRRDDDDYPPKKGMSGGMIALIVCGVLFVLAIPIIAILIGLLLPAVQKVREAASRMQASNNMKQVALAFHNHHDATGKLHGPFVDPPPGSAPINPTDRLSGRVQLLPYLEADNVYRQFKLDQPWNSPANIGPGSMPVRAFGDPIDGPPGPNTRVRFFYDNGALFDSDPIKRVSLGGITDGTSNTIAYVESADLVPWAKMNDFQFNPNAPLPPLGHPQRNTILVVMADGSVKTVSKSINPEVLKRCITRNDGVGFGTDLEK